jgi:hypothetical protein
MSDEYAASGHQGSLVNPCASPSSPAAHADRSSIHLPSRRPIHRQLRDLELPRRGRQCVSSSSHLHRALTSAPAATSSGGYGAGTSSFSRDAQSGRTGAERATAAADPTADMGLVQQSTSGGDLTAQAQDAVQGRDGGQNAYGESLESRAEAEQTLAGAYRDRRGEAFEGGAAGSAEQDVGA